LNFVIEVGYDTINIDKLGNLKTTSTSVRFNDDKNEYSFLFSKSVLSMKFYQPLSYWDIPVKIIEEPYDTLLEIYNQLQLEEKPKVAGSDYVILPLYSLRESKVNNKKVAEKSALNQWNAGGRKRDYGEVYIPIPKKIHDLFPNFFPSRDMPFSLYIPTGETLNAKLCQANRKALMTNPNNALSEWILRKVLKLKEGELLSYERLSLLGVDSVKITKIDLQNYSIDFMAVDSFESFIIETQKS